MTPGRQLGDAGAPSTAPTPWLAWGLVLGLTTMIFWGTLQPAKRRR